MRKSCIAGFSTVEGVAIVNVEGTGMIGVLGHHAADLRRAQHLAPTLTMTMTIAQVCRALHSKFSACSTALPCR